MKKIYNTLILKILNEIIPATKISISRGNKIFGGAILKKKDYSTLVIGTNNESINPENCKVVTDIFGKVKIKC